MTVEELSQVICSHTGNKTKVRGDEILLNRCLSCGNDRYNLQVNPIKGVFRCWACSYSGHVNEFLDKIGYRGDRIEVDYTPENSTPQSDVAQKYTFPSATDFPEAVTYLESRGVDLHDISHYGVCYQPPQGTEWDRRVVFPLRDYFSGEVVGYQGRHILGNDPKYKISHKFDNFIGYRNNSNTHVVTEGVFDGLNIHRAGYNASILLGTGNVKNWVGWASLVQINPNHKIFIMLDGEASKEAWTIRQLIAQVTDKVFALKLPANVDAGDLIPETIKRIIQKAEKHAN
jgi:DNA primase